MNCKRLTEEYRERGGDLLAEKLLRGLIRENRFRLPIAMDVYHGCLRNMSRWQNYWGASEMPWHQSYITNWKYTACIHRGHRKPEYGLHYELLLIEGGRKHQVAIKRLPPGTPMVLADLHFWASSHAAKDFDNTGRTRLTHFILRHYLDYDDAILEYYDKIPSPDTYTLTAHELGLLPVFEIDAEALREIEEAEAEYDAEQAQAEQEELW